MTVLEYRRPEPGPSGEGGTGAPSSYWDAVTVGEVVVRDLDLTAELMARHPDLVADHQAWCADWLTSSGEGPRPPLFGASIVPPALVSHLALSLQFEGAESLPRGSVHRYHECEVLEPVPVGAGVRITWRTVGKFAQRGRRYVRYEVTVADARDGVLYLREVRDTLAP